MPKKQINFKFRSNWSKFSAWFDSHEQSVSNSPLWIQQTNKIEELFNETNPNIINWNKIWKNFAIWYNEIHDLKNEVTFKEQKTQIETLMINGLHDLNKQQYILTYLNQGLPDMNFVRMTYWEAKSYKEELEGDSNGTGGNESFDKITIVNLETLIK